MSSDRTIEQLIKQFIPRSEDKNKNDSELISNRESYMELVSRSLEKDILSRIKFSNASDYNLYIALLFAKSLLDKTLRVPNKLNSNNRLSNNSSINSSKWRYSLPSHSNNSLNNKIEEIKSIILKYKLKINTYEYNIVYFVVKKVLDTDMIKFLVTYINNMSPIHIESKGKVIYLMLSNIKEESATIILKTIRETNVDYLKLGWEIITGSCNYIDRNGAIIALGKLITHEERTELIKMIEESNNVNKYKLAYRILNNTK